MSRWKIDKMTMLTITCYEKILPIALLVIIVGCSEKNKLSINKAGELQFRRSYAAIQFRDMSDQELDSIEKSNPEPAAYTSKDTALLKRFHEIGLVDNKYALKRVMFVNGYKTFQLTSSDNKISCHIVRPADSTDSGLYDLIVRNGNQRSIIRIEGHYGGTNEDIKYLLLDIITGGFKEIVILEEYYIMNGDNSDLYIYEIKQD